MKRDQVEELELLAWDARCILEDGDNLAAIITQRRSGNDLRLAAGKLECCFENSTVSDRYLLPHLEKALKSYRAALRALRPSLPVPRKKRP